MVVLHWEWRKVGRNERFISSCLCESEAEKKGLATETKLGLTSL